MKLTKQQLKQIIKEELQKALLTEAAKLKSGSSREEDNRAIERKMRQCFKQFHALSESALWINSYLVDIQKIADKYSRDDFHGDSPADLGRSFKSMTGPGGFGEMLETLYKELQSRGLKP